MEEIAKNAVGDISLVIAYTNCNAAKQPSGKPSTVAEARVLEFGREPRGKSEVGAMMELAESTGDGYSIPVVWFLSYKQLGNPCFVFHNQRRSFNAIYWSKGSSQPCIGKRWIHLGDHIRFC